MTLGMAMRKALFRNIQDTTFWGLLGGYITAIVAACIAYMVCEIIDLTFFTPQIAPSAEALGIVMAMILPVECIVGAPKIFLLTLLPWIILFYFAGLLKLNNLAWYLLFGSLMIFLTCSSSIFGMVPLILNSDNYTPAEQISRAIHFNGPIYIIMGLAFGTTFWGILAMLERPAHEIGLTSPSPFPRTPLIPPHDDR